MDEFWDIPDPFLHFNTTQSSSREAAHFQGKPVTREELHGKSGGIAKPCQPAATHKGPVTCVLALNGQPYPTLPFSLGGYGIEENVNQLLLCRRLGKGKSHHQRRPSRQHKSRSSSSSSRPQDRSRSSIPPHNRAFERKRSESNSNKQIVPRPMPSHHQPAPPRLMPQSLRSAGNNSRGIKPAPVQTFIWQESMTMNFPGTRNRPKQSFPTTRMNGMQPAPRPHMIPDSRPFQPRMSGYREPYQAVQQTVPFEFPVQSSARWSWNEEQWLWNQMNHYVPNVNWSADAQAFAALSSQWWPQM